MATTMRSSALTPAFLGWLCFVARHKPLGTGVRFIEVEFWWPYAAKQTIIDTIDK